MTLKIKNVDFIKSCTKVKDYPVYTYPEFAFLGRSNVGKSSLINMIVNRHDLVKTGSRPGVTQTINFFVANNSISLVDLPGYGFAKVPVNIKKSFMPMVKNYLSSKRNIKLVFMLIDIRRKPGDFEHEILTYIVENKIPVAVTVTKSDKLSKNQRIKNLRQIEEELELEKDSLFITSAQSGEGKKDILKLLTATLNDQL